MPWIFLAMLLIICSSTSYCSSRILPAAAGIWPAVVNFSTCVSLKPGVLVPPTNVLAPAIVPTAICGVATVVGPSITPSSQSFVVTLSVAAAMPHAYTAFAAIEPRAQKGIADAAEFFKGA